jgi:hypothetical protein
VLFDGASLALYLIGVGVYIANIVKGLRLVSAGIWDDPVTAAEGIKHEGPLTGEVVLGREDSLRVLSASNTILALVLVGVLVLQAGQWYAESKEADEDEAADRAALEKKEKSHAEAAAGGKGSKKKQ